MQIAYDRGRSSDAPPYPLGYSEREFARLQRQGEFLRDITEDMLRRAGIGPGMRVLDAGCGVGDVSMLAAARVGPTGAVLRIDRSERSLDVASQRAAAAGQRWLRFQRAELDTFEDGESFDALVGRLVLLYLPDPAGALRKLCRHLRPCGIVAFQEMAMPLGRCVPDAPLYRQCVDWIVHTLARAGVETDMGARLPRIFRAAGLPAPQMLALARVEAGGESPVYEYVAETVRTLLPLAQSVGVTSTEAADIDTLAERLRTEALSFDTSIMPPPLIGAWTRLTA